MRAAAQAAETGEFYICRVAEGFRKRSSTIRLGTGILAIYNRTPGLMALVALGMHESMDGRFVLGLGGDPYNGPMEGPWRAA